MLVPEPIHKLLALFRSQKLRVLHDFPYLLGPNLIFNFLKTFGIDERDHAGDRAPFLSNNDRLSLYGIQKLSETILRLSRRYDGYFGHKSHCSYYRPDVNNAVQHSIF